MSYLNIAGLFKTLLCPAGFQDALRVDVVSYSGEIQVDYVGRGILGEIKLEPVMVAFVIAVILLLYACIVLVIGRGVALLLKKIPYRSAAQKKIYYVLLYTVVISLFFLLGFFFMKNENAQNPLVMPLFNKILYPGQTVSLVEAVRRGKIDVAEKLIKEGADILGRNAQGESPLGVAEKIGNPQVVALLISELAKTRPGIETLYARGILFTEENFIHEIEKDNREAVALFIKSGIRLNPYGEQDAYCPLGQAVVRGYIQTAELLLEKGARLEGCFSHRQYLVIVAEKNQERMLELLLKNGADINGVDPQGRSALMAAAAAGNTRVVSYLLPRGADLRMKNKNEEDAVLLAGMNLYRSPVATEENPYFQIIKILGEKGADLNLQNKQGWTLIMYGALYGHVPLVRYLIGRNVNVNSYLFEPRAEGVNALQMAAKRGYPAIVELLTKAGARE
jgi:ankyrin repeat protein